MVFGAARFWVPLGLSIRWQREEEGREKLYWRIHSDRLFILYALKGSQCRLILMVPFIGGGDITFSIYFKTVDRVCALITGGMFQAPIFFIGVTIPQV